MTLIEDYSSEAIIEIQSILEDRVRRHGKCQISSDTIKKTLKERFGLTGSAVKWLYPYIEGYFLGAGFLKIWAINERTKNRIVVFEIVADKLR